MGSLKAFIVPFIGLKDGSHEFGFEVNDTFFEAFPHSEIKKGNIRVNSEMIKHSHMLTFNMRMKGEAELPCDRCGNTYRQEIDTEWQIVVQLNAESFNDEDDLISLPAGAYEFDLSQNIYEYIMLNLPYRRVCGEIPDPTRGNCDPEILDQLNKLSPASEEEEESKPESDPRWDSLKNIKFDN